MSVECIKIDESMLSSFHAKFCKKLIYVPLFR